ncbi:peptidoglycan-binding protein [Streptomyces sp. NPDC056704]|uniref:peptidoglycan-binding domain-containing protein n=1 Tax=Streptomyces sp. NPDC056704 TaxID=3345917 RepID=UPI0036B5977A
MLGNLLVEPPGTRTRPLDRLDAAPVAKWTPQKIPQRTLLPAHGGSTPLVFDRFPALSRATLARDSVADILWFTPSSLTLTDFSLTVRREVRPDGAIAITGGSAVLSVSPYAGPGLRETARIRSALEAAPPASLERAVSEYAVQPTPPYGLTVDLQLPAGAAAAAPMVTVAPLSGSATIAVELTESGVLAWQSALQQSEGHTIAGTVRATAATPVVHPGNSFPSIDTRVLDTPLGALLAERGPADIHPIDPQLAVSAIVIVVASQLVTTSTIALHPSSDHPPTSAVFGPTGGRTGVTVVTLRPEALTVDWRADVAFTPQRWPVVPASGWLDSTSGWVTIIKPESWCVGYVFAVIPVDAAGQPVPAKSRTHDRIQGVLNFTAPYVAGGLLSSAFEAEYDRPNSFALPRYPDQPFGDLVLTVFANCGGRLGQASRKLTATEVVVSALAYPDGRIELHTDTDAPSETPVADLPTLRRGDRGPAVGRLQQLLNQRVPDLTPLTVDGFFGPVTHGRVREFQRRAGIVIDGIVGPQTWGALAG